MSKFTTYLMLVTVMIFWGMNVVAIKFLVDAFSPVMMQGLRIGSAGILILILLWFFNDLKPVTIKQWLYITAGALFGQVLHHGMIGYGLQFTTASNGSLILGLIPITTAIFSALFLKEPLSKLQFSGVIVAFAGVFFVVVEPNPNHWLVSTGDLFIFTGMMVQAFSFIIIRKATITMNPRQMTVIMLLIGAAFLTVFGFTVEDPNIPPVIGNSWIWIVFFSSAILATGLGHIMYNAAIQRIGAGQTAVFNNLVPLFAMTGAYFLLGEPIHLRHIVGFIFIVSGVFLGTGYIEQRINARTRASS
ncbi:DMT family transporter [Salisediminibacterium beveridgei]|uniref:Permease of the drug/metabolite transporter (DMT) superfamily n=1 Tax=Salisediminibacterium beveridgei TaxID=632773 RepID=A0A1D7QVG2_9BACI|nr:DMT family transporter [Salisediminibacterium beveridgei]AOM83006.1 Permease of the drug/metabolite transporter (DMT) superfamily [Salisediminibacterium beveridgei]